MTHDDGVILGVAIALPEPHASVLAEWRRRVGDPQAERVFPHVTLLPPTPVTQPLEKIESHLSSAAAEVEPFAMHLFGTGTFRPVSPVVFVHVAAGLSNCELLERAIRSGPLDRSLDFPYHPHVTVAHNVPDEALDLAYDGLAGFIARFVVDSFTLFEQTPAGGWVRRQDFSLGRR